MILNFSDVAKLNYWQGEKIKAHSSIKNPSFWKFFFTFHAYLQGKCLITFYIFSIIDVYYVFQWSI